MRAGAQIKNKEHGIKKLEKVLAVTAALILALSAAGCSSSSDDDDDETGGADNALINQELKITETPQLLVKTDELKNISSLTISITNIYTSENVWWFSAVNAESADGDYTNIEWKSGEGSSCIYELQITDFSSYANRIYIAGCNSTATVTVTKKDAGAGSNTPSAAPDTGTSNSDSNSAVPVIQKQGILTLQSKIKKYILNQLRSIAI